jgi:hypothetical protein
MTGHARGTADTAARRQLLRIRWAVRAALGLGVAASVAANTLHADPDPISRAIAAWPPIALLLTIELISRVPVHRRWLAAARMSATATIAGIAAWISYWHMAAVVARYGDHGTGAYLLPLSVDGLILVASVSLIELTGRLAATTKPVNTRAAASAVATGCAATPTVHTRPSTRRGAAAGPRGSATAVAAEVARLHAQMPSPHPTQIAAEVGRSVRQVLRIIKQLNETDDATPTGRVPVDR